MPAKQLSPGISIHYLDENPGGAPTALLLHGLGVTGDSWQLQVPALVKAGFRVIAPDSPGFGHTPYHGESSVMAVTQRLAALIEALEVGPVYLAGISMGGAHALQLALDYPDLVQRLALVNTFAHLEPPNLGGWLFFGLRFVLVHTLGLRAQAKAVAGRLFPKPEQEALRQMFIEQVLLADPQGYRAAMRALARFDVRRRLNSLQLPTLVITAERDTTIPPANQRSLAHGIPGASQVTIPEAGHAVTAEHPAAFNQVLLEFFCAPLKQLRGIVRA